MAKKKNTNMASLNDKTKKVGSATLRAERPAKSKHRLLRQNLGDLGRPSFWDLILKNVLLLFPFLGEGPQDM